MKNTVRFLFLVARLSVGACALALGLLTLTALAAPKFAAALAAQGMPTPLSWPAALAECGLALAAFFLHAPVLRSVVPREQRSRSGCVS